MTTSTATALDVIRAAYRLELSPQEWTSEIVRGISDNVAGTQRFGYLYASDGPSGAVTVPYGYASPDQLPDRHVYDLLDDMRQATSAPGGLLRLFTSIDSGTLSRRLRESDTMEVLAAFQRHGFGDVHAICAGNLDGTGFLFGSFLPAQQRPNPRFRRRWMAVAAHIAAAVRLRARLGSTRHLEAAEFIIDGTSGATVHAAGQAMGASAQRALRAAVVAHAASQAEADVDTGLSRWAALVAGRWTIVDAFDTDARRFVVAIPNAPAARKFAALSERQAQLVELLLQQHSQKFIAYELGLSESTVAGQLSVIRKLFGAANNAQLVDRLSQLLSGQALPAVSPLEVTAFSTTSDVDGLTEAQSEIVALLRKGASNAKIADQRGTSQKTVQNQLHALYRHYQVSSRAELVGRLAAAEHAKF